MLLVREVECGWCGLIFYLCRRYWRGQAYCCRECSALARRRSHWKAQKRYRRSAKGCEAHRLAERRRRMHRRKKPWMITLQYR